MTGGCKKEFKVLQVGLLRWLLHHSDTLRTTIGLRYGTEEKTAGLYAVHNTLSPLVNAGRAPWPLGGFHGAIDADYDREDTAFTWSANIQKDLSDTRIVPCAIVLEGVSFPDLKVCAILS